MVKKAVIPAAGWGTRFLPATKSVPKEMLPIVDKPTIQYVIEELAAAGVEEFFIIVMGGKEALFRHFQSHEALNEVLKSKQKLDLLEAVEQPVRLGKVRAVNQGQPKGLGHAVWSAHKEIGDEPFLVALGDDLIDAEVPCAQQMVQYFNTYQKPMVAVQEVSDAEIHKYGVVAPKKTAALDGSANRLLALDGMVEKPSADKAPSNLAIIGRYLLTPDIFPILEQTTPGAGEEIQLTDALKTLNEKSGICAYRFSGQRFDAGDKFGYLQANVHYGLKNNEVSEKLKSYIKTL